MAAYSETDSEVNRDQTQTEDDARPNGPDQDTGSAQDQARAALAAEVERLSKLSQTDYVLERKAAAKVCGIGVVDLDKLVAQAREGSKSNTSKGTLFEDRQAWPDPVDGLALMVDMHTEIAKYVVLLPSAIDTVCLWVVASYVYDQFDIFPRLAIKAPQPECGKTTLLAVIHQLVNRPCNCDNATTAALFRMIGRAEEAGEQAPTLLCDEADTWVKRDEEMRGIINSGHRRGAQVLRCVGDEHEVKGFPVFSAMVLTYIGDLAQTIEDRATKIELKRRMRSEKVVSLRSRQLGRLPELAAKAARWARDRAISLAAADPTMPEEITNRIADNWVPLFAVADLLGGEWPERAREIAIGRHLAGDSHDPSLPLKLLRDIRVVFQKSDDKLHTSDLLSLLWQIEESPWNVMPRGGRQLDASGLAYFLRPFGIESCQIKIGNRNRNGYRALDFADAWGRYLP